MCVTSLVADSVKVTVRELVAAAPPLMTTLPVRRRPRLGTRQQNERHERGFHAGTWRGSVPFYFSWEHWVRVRSNGRRLRPAGV